MEMDNQTALEQKELYASATGLPPTGLHRKFADHVISSFAVRCVSCNGTGSQVIKGIARWCSDCDGLKGHPSAAAVTRLHQVVIANFPDLRNRSNQEAAVQRWAARKWAPATGPMYLGHEEFPPSVPRAPSDTAIHVASIKWRHGLQSELLWTTFKDDKLWVLWERLPELLLPNSESWTEVFSWSDTSNDRSPHSVHALLEHG